MYDWANSPFQSTVINAVRKIERLCGEDTALRSVVNTIESHLRQS